MVQAFLHCRMCPEIASKAQLFTRTSRTKQQACPKSTDLVALILGQTLRFIVYRTENIEKEEKVLAESMSSFPPQCSQGAFISGSSKQGIVG